MGTTYVVAAALNVKQGRWLMQRRPADKHHGGLWEFPGGKIESGESPVEALVRECEEELAIVIDPASVRPLGFADGNQLCGADNGIVLLLYEVSAWQGEPTSQEGATIGWFDPAEMRNLDRPPLDQALVSTIFG